LQQLTKALGALPLKHLTAQVVIEHGKQLQGRNLVTPHPVVVGTHA